MRHLVLAAALLAPGSALACEAFCPELDFVAPGDGAVAPTNTRIWAGGSDGAPELELRDDAGAIVSLGLHVIETDAGYVAVGTPPAPLRPGVRYTVIRRSDVESQSSFTTAEGPDDESPGPPRLREAGRAERQDECGDEWGLRLANRDDEALLVAVEPGRSFVADRTRRVLVLERSLGFGNFHCERHGQGDDLSDVEVAAVDLAGNVSPKVTPEFTLPNPGCATGGHGAGLLGLWAVALATRGARRVRRGS